MVAMIAVSEMPKASAMARKFGPERRRRAGVFDRA
jgi:hypothetical protein